MKSWARTTVRLWPNFPFKPVQLIGAATLSFFQITHFCEIVLNSMNESSKRTKTDHCNGEFFFNPGLPVFKKTFADLLKWQLQGTRKAWPPLRSRQKNPKLDLILDSNDCQLTFVNHATVYAQTPQVSFVTDPVWSDRTSPFQWIGPKRRQAAGFAIEEIPKLDFILLSHNHYDHMDESSLRFLAQRYDPAIFIPLGLESPIRDFGFTKIVEMDWWETSTFMDARVTFLPAQHWSGRWIRDRNRSLWGSFMVETPKGSLYFAGDTGYSPHFKEIRSRIGSPSIALLPIGAYEPRWFMKQAHMNPADAVQAHMDLGTKQSMAIHFGTWQLTDEGIDEPVEDLKKAIFELKPDAPFFVLENGESKLVSLELPFVEFQPPPIGDR